jgi:transcriptional regulator with XRE-family HTH domain
LALSCGMSHIAVAAALGLKPRELSAIERGEIRAGGKLVIRAAKLFGVQPSSFFDVASIKQASDGASQRPSQRAQRANRRPSSVLCCKANRRTP